MSETLTAEAPNPVVESAIAKIGEIATLPEVTVKIIRIVEDPKTTARDLHEVIRHDPGLSANKNISIAMSMARMFKAGAASDGMDGKEVWRHSMAVGVASRMLTKMQGRPTVDESFLAGLLHDLGLLVERQAFGPKMKEIIKRYEAAPKPFCQIETEVLGADHQLFGQALAARWRFPRGLRTAIGYHHRPMDLAVENREIAAIVHIADVLACRTGIGFSLTAF